MVNSDGQLYTIEGFAAALIMLITAYLVLNATSVYTAGDTHITDMQLEALGTDALMMMGTKESLLTMSPLESIVENPVSVPNATFRNLFLNYTNVSGAGPIHDIQFVANYTCRVNSITNPSGDEIRSIPISYSRNLTGGEHTVRATRWVMVNNQSCNSGSTDPRAVLVEVLLWRD